MNSVHETKTSFSKTATIIALIGVFSFSVLGQAAKDAAKAADVSGEIISTITLEGFQNILQSMGLTSPARRTPTASSVIIFTFKRRGIGVWLR